MMNVHLYTTDDSAFCLLKILSKKKEQVRVTAVIVPQNRIDTQKVINIIKNIRDIPIYIQSKKNSL